MPDKRELPVWRRILRRLAGETAGLMGESSKSRRFSTGRGPNKDAKAIKGCRKYFVERGFGLQPFV